MRMFSREQPDQGYKDTISSRNVTQFCPSESEPYNGDLLKIPNQTVDSPQVFEITSL